MKMPKWHEVFPGLDAETVEVFDRFQGPQEVAKSIKEARTTISKGVSMPNLENAQEVIAFTKRVSPTSADAFQIPESASSKQLLESLRSKAVEVGVTAPAWAGISDQIEKFNTQKRADDKKAQDAMVASWQDSGRKKHGPKFDELQAGATRLLDKFKAEAPEVQQVMEATNFHTHPAFMELLARAADITSNDGGPKMSQGSINASGRGALELLTRMKAITQDADYMNRVGARGALLGKEFREVCLELKQKHDIDGPGDPKIANLVF